MSSKFSRASRKLGVALGTVLLCVLVWLGLCLLIAGIGIHHRWGEISVRQMAMSIGNVDPRGLQPLEWQAFWGIVVAPIVLTLLIIAVHHFLRRRKRLGSWDPRPKKSRRVARSVSVALVLVLVGGGSFAFATSVSLDDFVRAEKSDMDIGDYDVEPQVTDTSQKRNIVNIYLESGEQTLADDDLFEKDPYAPLEERTADWQKVDDYKQYDGGGWTMAGLVSSQCGIPLKSTSPNWYGDGNPAPPDDVASYLKGATCAGDVFKEQGYKNVFMGGSDSEFAAKGTFFKTHGYDEVKDLDDWEAAGEPDKNFREDWGLSDEALLRHAKDEIDQLHADSERTGQPFNLSMLTLDTHEPTTVYDYCTVDTKNELTSAYQCSMEKVSAYLDYMQEKGYLDDTAVVLQGDHLKHMKAKNAFHDELDKNDERSIFNRVWVPGESRNRQLRADSDQLNMYPTILEAAGIQVQDHSAGLGVSQFTDEIPDDSAQALAPQKYGELLTARSKDFYAKAWDGEEVGG